MTLKYPAQREFRSLPLEEQRAEVRAWFFDQRDYGKTAEIWALVANRLGHLELSDLYLIHGSCSSIDREINISALRKLLKAEAESRFIEKHKDTSDADLERFINEVVEESKKGDPGGVVQEMLGPFRKELARRKALVG